MKLYYCQTNANDVVIAEEDGMACYLGAYHLQKDDGWKKVFYAGINYGRDGGEDLKEAYSSAAEKYLREIAECNSFASICADWMTWEDIDDLIPVEELLDDVDIIATIDTDEPKTTFILDLDSPVVSCRGGFTLRDFEKKFGIAEIDGQKFLFVTPMQEGRVDGVKNLCVSAGAIKLGINVDYPYSKRYNGVAVQEYVVYKDGDNLKVIEDDIEFELEYEGDF